MTDKKTTWNQAGVAGLVLGGVCIVYMLITGWTGKLGSDKPALAMLISILNLVLWAAKFFGCICLMKFFLKKFAAGDPEEDNRSVFAFGVKVALLSALVYSAFWLADMTIINPDALQTALDTVMQSFGDKLDSNSLQALDESMSSFPTVGFFTNLVYCFLFGTVLSAIQSRNIPPRNPFEQK